jgi:hypothetical protein
MIHGGWLVSVAASNRRLLSGEKRVGIRLGTDNVFAMAEEISRAYTLLCLCTLRRLEKEKE